MKRIFRSIFPKSNAGSILSTKELQNLNESGLLLGNTCFLTEMIPTWRTLGCKDSLKLRKKNTEVSDPIFPLSGAAALDLHTVFCHNFESISKNSFLY